MRPLVGKRRQGAALQGGIHTAGECLSNVVAKQRWKAATRRRTPRRGTDTSGRVFMQPCSKATLESGDKAPHSKEGHTQAGEYLCNLVAKQRWKAATRRRTPRRDTSIKQKTFMQTCSKPQASA